MRLRGLDGADQRIDVDLVAVDAKRRARRRGETELVHQRLGAMMAGADGDIVRVEHGGESCGCTPSTAKDTNADPMRACGDQPSRRASSASRAIA